MPTPSTDSPKNSESGDERQRHVNELFPTYEVAKAYLRSLRIITWGQPFHIGDRGSMEKAAVLLTEASDAINAIRNIALEHGVGLDDAARQYWQLTNPTITRGQQ